MYLHISKSLDYTHIYTSVNQIDIESSYTLSHWGWWFQSFFNFHPSFTWYANFHKFPILLEWTVTKHVVRKHPQKTYQWWDAFDLCVGVAIAMHTQKSKMELMGTHKESIPEPRKTIV